MSKETLVFVIGCIVLVTPFLGLPGGYKKWLLVSCGLLLVVIGYTQRRHAFLRSFEHSEGERRSDVFVENTTQTREKTPTHNDSGPLV